MCRKQQQQMTKKSQYHSTEFVFLLKQYHKMYLQCLRVHLQLPVNLGHSDRERRPLYAVCAAENKLR